MIHFKRSFIEFCKKNNLEINQNQLEISELLDKFYNTNFKQSLFSKILKTKNNKIGFYLTGDVGVGKTMILNLFFDEIKEKKLRLHFNEFMINFHDFIFQNKDDENGLVSFVKNLKKKTDLLYFDEFQVTNIVDAMILGRLFEKIFSENIKVIFTSNTKIDDLYKDGLQREQFLPFIKILMKNCLEINLKIEEDYRSLNNSGHDRFLFPLNQSTNFLFNKYLRKFTKYKKKSLKKIFVKGRKFEITDFYEGIAKFEFEELCKRSLGSEDYINIATICNFIFIKNLPNFRENNSDQQQRFITLIDILYEKQIPLMISSEVDLKFIQSSPSLKDQFKRTISRLYELTSIDYNLQ